MSTGKDHEDRILELVQEIREDVERVLVVSVDPDTGEVLDASVHKLEGFIRTLAEAAEEKAKTGAPIRLTWQPPGSRWWKPNG